MCHESLHIWPSISPVPPACEPELHHTCTDGPDFLTRRSGPALTALLHKLPVAAHILAAVAGDVNWHNEGGGGHCN